MLSGPQVSWMCSASVSPRKCEAVPVQLDDSLNCYLCLTRASAAPLCWKEEERAEEDIPFLN